MRAEIDMKIKAEMENKDSIIKTERKRGFISLKSSKDGILIFWYSVHYFMVLDFNKLISKIDFESWNTIKLKKIDFEKINSLCSWNGGIILINE